MHLATYERKHAGSWFFLGFLALGAIISALLVYGFDQHEPRYPKAMSFGIGVQSASAGAFVCAVGYFFGLRYFQALFSRKHSAAAGAVLCVVLYGLLTAGNKLGLPRAVDIDLYGLLVILVAFLGGFLVVPLGRRIHGK